jgi:carotenoid cleavage dioxygenase
MDRTTGTFDLTVGLANTHVIRHAGRILALEEASFPNELTPELDTLGPWDFDGRLRTAMTAHPHTCAETGEMHFFGYGFLPPYLTYHVADPAGHLVHSQAIDVPGSTMIHDFALSRHHAIFLDLPVVFDLDGAVKGGMPYRWDHEYGARIGLLRRDRLGEQPRWFDIEPCYVFHIVNAWDDGDSVWLDAGRHRTMWDGGPDQFEPSYLWRWRFDLGTGVVKEEQLDGTAHAFPRIDDRRTGLANRYGWAVAPRAGAEEGIGAPSVVVKWDLATGTSTQHDFGPTCSTGEPVFVPSGAGEDEGWVMSYVYDRARDTSDFVILDASDVAADPVAVVALPRRIPHGFHASWFAD